MNSRMIIWFGALVTVTILSVFAVSAMMPSGWYGIWVGTSRKEVHRILGNDGNTHRISDTGVRETWVRPGLLGKWQVNLSFEGDSSSGEKIVARVHIAYNCVLPFGLFDRAQNRNTPSRRKR